MMSRQIFLVINDVRSSHNIGSLLRTADGLGVDHVYICGYSPYPQLKEDGRLPHIHRKVSRQIKKTSLGAEESVRWSYHEEAAKVLGSLKNNGVTVAALEQTGNSTPLHRYDPPEKVAIVVGSEVGGIGKDLLALTDLQLEIPMLGKKDSFNVSVAAAVALYHLRYTGVDRLKH